MARFLHASIRERVMQHEDVDQDVLWQTLQEDLPALAEMLKSIDASE